MSGNCPVGKRSMSGKCPVGIMDSGKGTVGTIVVGILSDIGMHSIKTLGLG